MVKAMSARTLLIKDYANSLTNTLPCIHCTISKLFLILYIPRTDVYMFLPFHTFHFYYPFNTDRCRPQEIRGGAFSIRPIFVFLFAGLFYVQKFGPRSIELDKLVQEMTAFYEIEPNRRTLTQNQVFYQASIYNPNVQTLYCGNLNTGRLKF